MEIYLERNAQMPLYQSIYTSIKNGILSGELPLNEKLPPTRRLAEELEVSRNTVELAYQQLLSEGYLVSRQGSGYRVAEGARQEWFHERAQDLLPYPAPASHAARYDLWYPLVDSSLFPDKAWRKAMAGAMLQIADSRNNSYYPAHTGEATLRETLCIYLRRLRGVNCEPQQILIGCGLQINLELLLKLFSPDQCPIAMEEPGYYGARDVFLVNGFSVLPIPVDSEGIRVDRLNDTNAKLLYITPSHQFPTGVVLPVKRRLELLSWAQKQNAYIIEDDYDSELRYQSKPISAMQSLDKFDRVIYAGTFSKSLSPGLRISYLVLPKRLVYAYHQTCNLFVSQVPLLMQAALAAYIQDGYLDRHMHKMRTLYRKKHLRFLDGANRIFGENIRICSLDGGVHFLAEFRSELSDDALIRRAADCGIAVYTTRECWLYPENAPKHQFLLGYGAIPLEEIDTALQALYTAWYGKMAEGASVPYVV